MRYSVEFCTNILFFFFFWMDEDACLPALLRLPTIPIFYTTPTLLYTLYILSALYIRI